VVLLAAQHPGTIVVGMAVYLPLHIAMGW